ncbi:hypothetical protein, partial [Paracoccus sp. (in: a-proteobacteria)]|uniref:hypothetical protein n=1 Tax=Paracoccus sp. TaxID=267 RepID=UPI0040589943
SAPATPWPPTRPQAWPRKQYQPYPFAFSSFPGDRQHFHENICKTIFMSYRGACDPTMADWRIRAGRV